MSQSPFQIKVDDNGLTIQVIRALQAQGIRCSVADGGVLHCDHNPSTALLSQVGRQLGCLIEKLS
jgi:hypothetical protein